MKRKFFLPFFVSAIFLLQSTKLTACNYTAFTLTSPPVNNGDGTYTFIVHVALGLKISWGGTTDFSLSPSGGSFTTVSSFSPMTITSNYIFCPQCNTGDTICTSASINVIATADGILNGLQTVINFSQTSSFPSTGCSPPAACWGNGYPFVSDDYQAVCVSSNPDSLSWDITITTNGFPDIITFLGGEDDIGPDIMLSAGCAESILLNFPTYNAGETMLPNESGLFHNASNNYFLNLNLSAPYSFTTTIFSAEGKKVFSQNHSLTNGGHKILLPTENLSRGIYFCRVIGEGINKAFKFVR